MFRLQQKWFIAILLILALALVGCSGQTPEPDDGGDGGGEEPPTGDTEDSGDGGESPQAEEPAEMPATVSADLVLDPANAAGDPDLAINDMVYDGLVSLSGGEVVEGLASSWQVAEDGLTYTFNLRAGATFSDGTPVDADAVEANVNRWFDPASPLRGSGAYDAWLEAFLGFKGDVNDDEAPVSVVDGVEKVDTLTVLIHLNTADPDFLTKLAGPAFGLVSPAALEAAGGDYGAMGTELAGAGPYVVGEWTSEQLVLDPFAEYWGTVPSESLTYPVE